MQPERQNDSTAETGLTSAEAARRLAKVGPNELAVERRLSPIVVFVRQFTSPLVLMLFAAAAIAAWLGDRIDTAAILLVVALNGILGFVQEWRAETAVLALRRMLSASVRVMRDGIETIRPTRELVPGDLVLIEAGDRVPADLKLSAALHLKVDESPLTGESVPVDKSVDPDEDTLFMGTSVVAGRGEGIVETTGPRTEFGKIAGMTARVGEKTTHLQRHLTHLARQLGLAAILIALAVVAAGLVAGRAPVEMVLIGLSLAVAIVPEGLPAVVTVSLALGASAMARRHALVRRLQAVETLGAASVICTDKTGTLTENKMTATRIWTPERRYSVTGSGYDPTGHIAFEGHRTRAGTDPVLGALLDAAITCNHSRLNRKGEQWEAIGEPTETALVTLAYKGWVDLPDQRGVMHEIPFTSERKRMSVIVPAGDGLRLHSKGAPEAIIDLATNWLGADGAQPLDAETRQKVADAYEEMSRDGLRVIALAERPFASMPRIDEAERSLTFLGLVGLIDPPRPEVRSAVNGARAAGIRVLLITGDAPLTAEAVARDLGLPVGRTLTGEEIDEMDADALSTALSSDVIFARTAPAHKLRIVETLQAQDQVVAMTGDGVNDAPALRRADIGIAMGQRGTDVAKDAADLVLLDDNFATIVGAIREGRRQFDNVRKFVRYLLSSNAGEIVAIVANIVIGGPLIFLATQILWMNLITDGITAVALSAERAEEDQMRRPPRQRDEPIIGTAGLFMIVLFGLYTGGASLWLFQTFLPEGETLARTVAFTGMVLFEKCSVFAFRSLTRPCTTIGWLSNRFLIVAFILMIGFQAAAVYVPPLQALLHTTALDARHWLQMAAFALPLILVPELLKAFVMRKQGQVIEPT